MAKKESARVNVDASLEYDTSAAFLLKTANGNIWVPKSQASDNYDGTFSITEWFAKDKGLI